MSADPCPDCGSRDVEAVSVVEHEACGAVKFEHAFRRRDRFVCPDCGEVDASELSAVQSGRLHRCTACEHCFDEPPTRGVHAHPHTHSHHHPRSPSSPQEPTWSGATTDLWTGLVDSRTTLHTVVTGVVLLLLLGSTVTAAFDPAPRVEERTENGEWHSYQSIVVFRNDDVQPYYRTEAMRAVDRVFVEEGVPVTVSIIPAPGNATIDADMQVCEYWREQRATHPEVFEYALHGYHHADRTGFHGRSEFGGVPRDVQERMVERGGRLMADCLGTQPDVFVPPFETYDANTSRVLADQGFVAVSSGEWFESAHANRTGPYETDGIVHVPSDGGFVENWSDVSFYSERTLETRFDRAYRNGSLYVQMLHYQYFTTPARLAVLRDLIDHMQSREGVTFMTVGEFARGYASGRIERTDDGWRVWKPDRPAPTPLDWFVQASLARWEGALPREV